MVLKSFKEYEDLCFGKVNDKIKVVDSIKTLNEKLHSDGINEKLRSQFVGTCLLALKNGLTYKDVKETLEPKTGKKKSPEKVVLQSIKDILEGLLTRSGSLNKASKLSILNNKVLGDQDVRSLTYDELKDILSFIDDNVVPYINDKNTAGQDLLNLFFTTFNKYVGKSDKNQAFTPDHICDFMSKAVGVNKNSRVLDPCCGSGAFLVRAMTDAMDDCDTEEERENVKKNQIFGIEYEDGAFGLSSTNMLIHGDGNSNVVQDSMFKRGKWIQENDINIVLMNPPYNATKKCCDPQYTKDWSANKKEDPSKGFHFVEWVARHVSSNCKMAVLLPMQAAIGNSADIKAFKKKMLDHYTLDAVFSLPNEMFYPGASAVACCMIFDLSQKHERSDRDTFFGYFKDDTFIKRKSLGRVEKTDENGNSLWVKTEEMWLDLYKNKRSVPGLSVMKRVKHTDEWLAEAYMETDYSVLTKNDFQKVINNYLSYLVNEGAFWHWFDECIRFATKKPIDKKSSYPLNINCWKKYRLEDLFCFKKGTRLIKEDMEDGNVNYLGAISSNNGVRQRIACQESDLYTPNCITVNYNGSVGEAFYQKDPFWASDDVNVLYAKEWWQLNAYRAMFLITIIRINKYKFDYGRKWTMEKMKESTILLPSKTDGTPDWEWMENYIKSLPYSDRI